MATAEGFGARLRELREQAGLTQDQLAEKAGFRRGAVARWERNTREPSWGNVLALAAALEVTCEAFTVAAAGPPQVAKGRPRRPPATASLDGPTPAKVEGRDKRKGTVRETKGGVSGPQSG